MERKKGGKMDEENGKLIQGEERFKRYLFLFLLLSGNYVEQEGCD